MAYDRAKIYEDAKKAIKYNGIIFIDEMIAFLPVSMSTFYEWYPASSEEMEVLKALINKNKVKTKINIRNSWKDSKNVTAEAMLYKLCGTTEEREILNNKQEQPVTHNITVEYGQEPPK